MNTDIWTVLIQSFITITTGGFIVKILRQQIKSQQEEIDTMKSSIDMMKSYLQVFDPEKLKEYVSVVEIASSKKGKMKAEEYWSQYFNEEIMPKIENYHKQIHALEMEKLSQKKEHLEKQRTDKNKYEELLNAVTLFGILIPKSEREEVLKKISPKNYHLILSEIESINPEMVNKLEQIIRTQSRK